MPFLLGRNWKFENRNSKVENRYLDIEFRALMLDGADQQIGPRNAGFEFRFPRGLLW